jgi:glycerophosphoryl diester phosphodiesterase
MSRLQAGLAWLTARPVAHRGLHDGVSNIENTPSAVSAAVATGYAIEVDLQITADGEAMVHHDDALGRLTDGEVPLSAMAAADLKLIAFKQTADRMMSLGDLLDLVGGRATLLLELKSHWDGDRRLAERVCRILGGSTAPIAVMSFDPFQVAAVREQNPSLTRGIVAERWRRPAPGDEREVRGIGRLAYDAAVLRSRPQFLAYHVKDLPAAGPLLARKMLGLPLLTWTVRTDDDRARAARWADQMIFEGFRP